MAKFTSQCVKISYEKVRSIGSFVREGTNERLFWCFGKQNFTYWLLWQASAAKAYALAAGV